ncbi:MAG: MBL fold metallo-hydrolase [Candidatus Cloacimonetes bacterium]|nr:MBL fold metallo-hydrolase [Candidatus Cloacimonadota bacterium]MCF7813153.1 MBL fold metallo-hydrolase [Candidatus Cloacimonadota bacterium]MCF7867601.1 MBL fold metallo-hydrolase [Candidatus Cloacimonadota bacterium]MCF7883124.1 MBL fold metallo-hydrolase [Candidatus Cloacimonadota bacterium]
MSKNLIFFKMQIGKYVCNVVSAGSWMGDGGAAMGVMPKALWKKLLPCDNKNRIPLALNSLLIQTAGKNILIDTGIGNKLSPKKKEIYQASDFDLLENLHKLDLKREEIDYVILTHLHFDHAGGVVTNFAGKPELTFPNAIHVFQKAEWEIAQNPDELNKASYNFKDDLQLLNESGKYKVIEGDYELLPGVKIERTGGHSEGMQVVRMESDGELAYYAGDIIPMQSLKHLAVNSAFEICRKDSFIAKKKILTELKNRNGILFYAHDSQRLWERM